LAEQEAGGRRDAGVVVLGRIVDAYGLRGAVKVRPFADDPGVWGAMPHWWLGGEGDAPETWRRVRLVHCRERSGGMIATLEGVSDRDAAESLCGMLVGAPRSELPATGDGEYYWGDLVGLDVVNVRGQPLGRVIELIETAANDVLRARDEEGGERLLPFVGTVIREVDLAGRRIRVDWEMDW
jgi:16S rRNA processing protein RimM